MLLIEDLFDAICTSKGNPSFIIAVVEILKVWLEVEALIVGTFALSLLLNCDTSLPTTMEVK